ncbi:MAG: N-acetylmuramic acid 6-phosphate etherase [Saprospiraceae bacterium]|uniref:N-acetylmuramic acid 6-phosphate etherase n=1 Tax=Candidatus Opimibacter skivensis TaxID=2982028 RepID=A0A9D7SZ30_9BACT|nr:N-acetylmuramic acid 6-phosphate etherase [Candidatus Opimibacter skivensis]
MDRITEKDSPYRHLEKMSTSELLLLINLEDQTVALKVAECIPSIERLVEDIVVRMRDGGRLFYIGAGTSGRLGILDASECPPTFGVDHEDVIGLIAGGDAAIRKAQEFAEDDTDQAWKDVMEYQINEMDTLIGIAASGTTPYVIGGLKSARENKILTGCITCNPNAPLIGHADHPIVCVVGPEVVTGSTRMKAGTAQKMILNMISTTTMIRLGKIEDNKMVDMQPSNNKLIDRGVRMIMEATSLPYEEASALLSVHGSVRRALKAIT